MVHVLRAWYLRWWARTHDPEKWLPRLATVDPIVRDEWRRLGRGPWAGCA